jgi:hypothetical protein
MPIVALGRSLGSRETPRVIKRPSLSLFVGATDSTFPSVWRNLNERRHGYGYRQCRPKAGIPLDCRAASSARAGRCAVGLEGATMHTATPSPVPCNPRSLEQEPLDRAEAPSQAERCLGHSGSASAARSEARSRLVQPCDRQQDPRLRSRPLAGGRRMRRRQGAGSWHRDSEKDWATGPVRDHGADPDFDPRLAVEGRTQEWELPVPEPSASPTAPLYPAIRSHRPCLGRECWARQFGLRNTFNATDEGGADLQKDR